MAKAIWHYSVGGDEKGPVTPEHLKELATSGVLTATDLIWREGMEEWRPAGEVAGLFPAQAEPAAPPAEEAAPEPAAESPAISTDSESPTARARGRRGNSRSNSMDAMKMTRFGGWAVLALGLMAVLLSKGCDGIGNRWVDRLQSSVQLAQSKLQDKYDSKRLNIQARQDSIRDQDDIDADDREELSDLAEELQKVNEEEQKERRKLQQGSWRSMQIAARDAQANNRGWAVFREILFVLGTLGLSLGVLAVSVAGEGAERWVCMIMLAIITFSVYVGGVAWISSIPGFPG